MNHLFDDIPVLDLADFNSGSQQQKNDFVQALGTAYKDIGFVAIKNHGLSYKLCNDLYDVVRQFFYQPDEIKQKYEIMGLSGQRGYTGKGKEHAKGRTNGDLKEFYHVGQEVAPNDELASEYPENVWPEEMPDFRRYTLEAYQMLEDAGKCMLQAIALYLRLEENYFESKVDKGNSILRPIHYFPIDNPDEVPADAVRAAEHGDINLITLLMGASTEGLQVLRRDGK